MRKVEKTQNKYKLTDIFTFIGPVYTESPHYKQLLLQKYTCCFWHVGHLCNASHTGLNRVKSIIHIHPVQILYIHLHQYQKRI